MSKRRLVITIEAEVSDNYDDDDAKQMRREVANLVASCCPVQDHSVRVQLSLHPIVSLQDAMMTMVGKTNPNPGSEHRPKVFLQDRDGCYCLALEGDRRCNWCLTRSSHG